MLLRVPRWLASHELEEIFGAGVAIARQEPSDALTDAVVGLGVRPGVLEVELDEATVAGVPLLRVCLPATFPVDQLEYVDAAAQHMASARRVAALMVYRAQLLNDRAADFSGYANRLGGLPLNSEAGRLASWLSFRVAQSRAQLSKIIAALGAFSADHGCVGMDERANVRHEMLEAALERMRSHELYRVATADMQRAGELLSAAERALSCVEGLLSALVGARRDQQADRASFNEKALQVVAVVGPIVLVIATIPEGGHSGRSVVHPTIVRVALASLSVISLGALGLWHWWRENRRPAKGTPEHVEARLGVLMEAYANPVSNLLFCMEPTLSERLKVGEPVGVWVPSIQRVEAAAGQLVCTILEELRDLWDTTDRYDLDLIRRGPEGDPMAQRSEGLHRLDRLARAQELIAALYAHIDDHALPFPDVTLTVYLYGMTLGFELEPRSVLEEYLRGILIDGLDESLVEVQRVLGLMERNLRDGLGLAVGTDMWALSPEQRRASVHRLRDRKVDRLLAGFADLRLSELILRKARGQGDTQGLPEFAVAGTSPTPASA